MAIQPKYPLVDVVVGKREASGFSSSVVSWRFRIRSSPRCSGVVSSGEYKSIDGAFAAGERFQASLLRAISPSQN